MRNSDRFRGRRLWRVTLVVLGLLGGLAVFDAVLLFLVLLLSAIVIAPLSPYIGMLMLVALPLAAVAGGAIAWTAYTLLNDRATGRGPDERHLPV
jgi:positive regulator of sigma E activity